MWVVSLGCKVTLMATSGLWLQQERKETDSELSKVVGFLFLMGICRNICGRSFRSLLLARFQTSRVVPVSNACHRILSDGGYGTDTSVDGYYRIESVRQSDERYHRDQDSRVRHVLF